MASSNTDFTVKVMATPLEPNQTYFYRWRHGKFVSEVGSFRTAPPNSVTTDIRFAYSGDSDGTKIDGAPAINSFEALSSARAEGLDFFIYLGDTVYADSALRAVPAENLDDYRDIYKVNREIAALRNLMKGTSVYSVWDDHEVYNNWDGLTVDLELFANGRRAFLEYMPISEMNLPKDAACAGDPLFRAFHWGKDVDIIILDERSCRSGDAETIPCLSDLAPTAPPFLRLQFGLSSLPPSGCLDAIFDPSRTLLGDVQKELFKEALLNSSAKFKFVVNELPIQQLFASPYDRWEGYGAERVEVLKFIRDNNIENVIFLTTYFHGSLVNQVFIDISSDPEPIALEFVTGPIATNTFQNSVLAQAGAGGLAAFNLLLDFLGVDCRHLDAFSYGLVEINASAGTATITLKDEKGDVLLDQSSPTSKSCAKSIGS